MTKLSIITVAKGRLDTFWKACDAIWALADNPENIEHIVAYDNNDSEMEVFLSQYIEKYRNRKITGYKVTLDDYENRNMHADYWNPIARVALGEIVFGLCNDTIIDTQGYDTILLDSLVEYSNKYKHKAFQFLVDDDSGKIEEYPVNWFCSWIILSKDAVEIFNGIAPAELPFQGADRAVYQVMNNLMKPAQINLREKIKTIHMSHYTGRTEVDDITRHRPKNFNNPCVLTVDQFYDYVAKGNKLIWRI